MAKFYKIAVNLIPFIATNIGPNSDDHYTYSRLADPNVSKWTFIFEFDIAKSTPFQDPVVIMSPALSPLVRRQEERVDI